MLLYHTFTKLVTHRHSFNRESARSNFLELRLLEIFGYHDMNPRDGKISAQEVWEAISQLHILFHRSRSMQMVDSIAKKKGYTNSAYLRKWAKFEETHYGAFRSSGITFPKQEYERILEEMRENNSIHKNSEEL